MALTFFGIAPAILSILIGIIILIWPKSLNYAVAFYLIIVGVLALVQGFVVIG